MDPAINKKNTHPSVDVNSNQNPNQTITWPCGWNCTKVWALFPRSMLRCLASKCQEKTGRIMFRRPLSPPDVPQNATAVFLLRGCFHNLVLTRFLEEVLSSVSQSVGKRSPEGQTQIRSTCGSLKRKQSCGFSWSDSWKSLRFVRI